MPGPKARLLPTPLVSTGSWELGSELHPWVLLGPGGEATGWTGLSLNPTGLEGVGLQPWEGEESNHHFPDTISQAASHKKGRV